MARKPEDFSFEKALAELEALVEKMEQGDLGLEESLRHLERGIALTRSCQKALAEAEQKVQLLTSGRDGHSLAPFSAEAASED
ncbi:MAG TPA: exodeoxyribonuclease VII small subunit [Gammaproteobacteria bacterium]